MMIRVIRLGVFPVFRRLLLGALVMALPLIIPGSWLSAQGASPEAESESTENAAPQDGEEPPRSFREISLGMGLSELKDALERDGLFNFRGDRDVSFLPSREENLIETSGYTFIRRAFFQLKEEKLYIMAYTLNPSLIDHYSVYASLVEKYGDPLSITPREAVWESGATRLSLERPLTVKYIDLSTFNALLEESEAAVSRDQRLKEDFLNEF